MTKADKDPLRKAFDSACKPRVQAAVKAEREACAKLCDDKHDTWRFGDGEDSTSGPKDCAAAIRARGNT